MTLEETLGGKLRKLRLTVSVAESCTGGLLAARITDVPGSSDYFRGAIVAYQDEIKERLLQVNRETLNAKGAVSEETALEMACGCRRILSADLAVGITGVAGPGGGTPDKPVGLVYVAIVTRKEHACRKLNLTGDRVSVREQTVNAALEMALSLLEKGKP